MSDGNPSAPAMRLDLDEIERRSRAVQDAADSAGIRWSSTTLAMVTRIREQGAALIRAAELVEGNVSTNSQYDCAEDDPDWQEAQRWRELAGKGDVESPRAEVDRLHADHAKLEAIAKAATAFVDQQGKTVDPHHGLVFGVEDFALDQWRDLVKALEAAGR